LAGAGFAVYQATGSVQRLESALALLDEVTSRFRASDGGWYDDSAPTAVVALETDSRVDAGDAVDGGPAIVRPRDPADGAAPSGASAVTDALVTAFALTGDPSYRVVAEESLAAVTAVILRYPRSGGWHLAAAEALAAGPLQIAITVSRGDVDTILDPLVARARRCAPGGAVIDVGLADAPGRPLLADRPTIGDATTAYVCRGFVCDAPVRDVAALQAALRPPIAPAPRR
jgi:uncharacterized protein YyaL (SSP411 family)